MVLSLGCFSDIPATVARWAALGIRGVKVFAFGYDRDGVRQCRPNSRACHASVRRLVT
ncbi:hypothetical protein [Streptomyces sp. NPDC057496]|uniref:hypothetical protein n=1 Tax=Streptomyces sp. NPDC057496 TaxID=3346149 RepID=UPI00368ACBDB